MIAPLGASSWRDAVRAGAETYAAFVGCSTSGG